MLNDENFVKNLINKKKIYVIIIVDVESTNNENVSIFHFSSQLNKYENLFDKKKANILFELNKNNHVIDIIKNKKSLYIFLYNFSQTELTKFKRYLDDALAKN